MRESMIYNPCIYQLREPALKRMLAIIEQGKACIKNQTVFFGDSIIEFYDVKQYFKDHLIYNCGIAGASTDQLLSIIDEAVIKYHPSQVLLQVGTNDLGNTAMHSPRRIAMNIATIVDMIHYNLPECKIYVISPLPCLLEQEYFYVNGIRCNQFIKDIRRYLDEYVHHAYIFDVYEDMLLKEELYADGLHPNALGYEIMTKRILENMKL